MNRPIIDPEFHALIPPLSPDELSQLEANILADGCRDALVTWEGILIDGHNRFEICERLDLPYKTKAVALISREAAADWIDRNQLGRRNLTPVQMSLIRGRIYNRAKKAAHRPAKGDQFDPLIPQKTADRLAKEHGVSPATIKRDGKIAAFLEDHPKEAELIIRGDKKMMEVRREIKRKEIAEQPPMPTDKYRIVYADPPWKYGDTREGLEKWAGTAAEDHYPTLSIDELCLLPIREIVMPDAVLFLWVTSPLLAECWPVIDAWGFKYKASFIWDKVRHNFGHYNSVRHEILLVCTRGSCLPDGEANSDSVISIERKARHSEKPAEFIGVIESMYKAGKKIELFSRAKRDGWDAWGNESE